jgi:magnesium-transporting ATPase (P-type)
MITAVTMALALAFEPGEAGQMLQPPRDPRQALLSRALLWRVVLISLLMAGLCLGLFGYSQSLGWSVEASRTLAVNAMVACEIGYLFSCRSLEGWARFSWRDNPMVWCMVLLMAGLQVAFSHWSGLQLLFATADLPVLAWGGCVLIAGAVCGLVELEKWLMRKRSAKRQTLPGQR